MKRNSLQPLYLNKAALLSLSLPDLVEACTQLQFHIHGLHKQLATLREDESLNWELYTIAYQHVKYYKLLAEKQEDFLMAFVKPKQLEGFLTNLQKKALQAARREVALEKEKGNESLSELWKGGTYV